MFTTSHITIDRSAFAANLSFLRDRLGGARLCGVVKGNAYGHGTDVFVKVAMDAGVDYFGVYSAEEAHRLLSGMSDPRPDVFIMGMAEDDGLAWAIEQGVECCIHDHHRLEQAIGLARRIGRKARIHVELETGMHRTGFQLRQVREVIDRMEQEAEHLEFIGLFTHFAGAESRSNDARVRKQMEAFADIRKKFLARGLRPKYAHQACSAAMMNYPETIGPMARIGIMQYGFWPNAETWIRYSAVTGEQRDPLRRLIAWRSRVMAITEVKAGGMVGYGTSCPAPHAMRVAVVPVGYAHGFDRGLSNAGRVLIRGRQARVAGIVNMNAISVDVTDIPEVERGDEVVLIGQQDGQSISVASFSEMSEQLNYEMLTRLPRDIPRTIVDRN